MVKIFADCADLPSIEWAQTQPNVMGLTTNPSLMRKAGITSYREFAKTVLSITNKPVSFEVLADDHDTMMAQAQEIASWGENVYVKIPITDIGGLFNGNRIRWLWKERNIKVNVTAITTQAQISWLDQSLSYRTPMILSVFAGRIADTGQNPEPVIAYAKMRYEKLKNVEVLWASTREVYNAKQAESCGADIITMTPDLIRKMDLFGKDLTQYSLETVQQFFNDSREISF